MNGLDIIIRELRGARADLQVENARPMHIDQPIEQPKPQLPPRFRTCPRCQTLNEYRTVCIKCGEIF